MKTHMRNGILCCLALLCLLSGCQSDETPAEYNDTTPSPSTDKVSPVENVIQSEPEAQLPEQTEDAEPLKADGILTGENIQSIYYGPEGTLLVRTSDTLYWYDVGSGNILAQRPTDNWLDVEYYSVGDDFCAIGTLTAESTGGFVSSTGDTLCVFYDHALQETERITLNNFGDGSAHIKCAAVSNDGNAIAYCTMDSLYYYDRTADTLEMVLDLSDDHIESNDGLSGISALAFSPANDKILFCGETFSLPLTMGQYRYLTYGCISPDGSNFQNLSFQDFEAGSMFCSHDGHLFFGENMIAVTGKVVVVDSSTMTPKTYSLSTVSEGEPGVYPSQGGDHFATVQIGEHQAVIRIYSRETGELICTHTVEDPNESLFYRIPAIFILDSLDVCAVKFGGFSDVPSKVVLFSLQEAVHGH